MICVLSMSTRTGGPNCWKDDSCFSASWNADEYISHSWGSTNAYSRINSQTGPRSRSWSQERIEA